MSYRKSLFLASVVFVSLLTAACNTTSTGNIVFDPNLPREQTARVVFSGTLVVKELNGIRVYDEWYPGERYRRNDVILPAGPTSMLFDIRAQVRIGNSITNIRGDDVELRFDFEPGKTYSVGFYQEGMGAQTFFLARFKYGIAVWDNDTGSGEPIRSWELGTAN